MFVFRGLVGFRFRNLLELRVFLVWEEIAQRLLSPPKKWLQKSKLHGILLYHPSSSSSSSSSSSFKKKNILQFQLQATIPTQPNQLISFSACWYASRRPIKRWFLASPHESRSRQGVLIQRFRKFSQAVVITPPPEGEKKNLRECLENLDPILSFWNDPPLKRRHALIFFLGGYMFLMAVIKWRTPWIHGGKPQLRERERSLMEKNGQKKRLNDGQSPAPLGV